MNRKFIDVLKWIWTAFGITFLIIIFTGMVVYMAQDFSTKKYEFFLNLSQIALTLFGITLIGGIFESKKKGEKILKSIFSVNLCFLASFIGFMYLHSYVVIEWSEITSSFILCLSYVFMYAAMIMGFIGLLGGIYLLVKKLLDHYSTL